MPPDEPTTQVIRRDRLAMRWVLATLLAALVLGIASAAAIHFHQSRAAAELSRWESDQMMLGTRAVRERRAADAERIFRGVADRDPRALEPRRNLLYLLGLQMRTAEARDILWQIYQIDLDPRVLVDLVLELLADQHDVRGLAPELELLVAQTPDDPFLLRAWGMALLYQSRPRDALPHLERAARTLLNDPAGRFALAECLIMLGKPVNAEEILGPVPEPPVDASQWWLFRGSIEESRGLFERALASFESATAANPDNREAHFRLGQALMRLGRAEPAQRHLEWAGRIEERLTGVRREHQRVKRGGVPPADPRLFERLGRLCAQAGLVAESRAWYGHALKLDPISEESRASQARLHATAQTAPIALPRPLLASTFATTVTAAAASAIVRPSRALINTAATEQPPPFEEGAEAAGITYHYESGASERRLFLADTMGGGVGLIDFDNDGWMDIYLVNGCALPFDLKEPPRPNLLYRNQRDGTFRDITGPAGVSGQGYGMGCAVGDYDNDGDDDLFVTGLVGTILYRNRGDGTFDDVTSFAGVFSNRWTTAAGFGDFDGDGDLDLVVLAYAEIDVSDSALCRDGSGRPIHCAPARYPAQDDLLYRNNGNGTFTEVSRAAGFVAADGRGLGLAIADLDGDGKLDIFVANDASPNFLFQNRGGFRFEEIGSRAGVATNGSGRATASMGVIADDLDSDGRIDLFITNLVNESSTLFRNLGGMLFVDATLGCGLDAPSRLKTGFGDAALDADNDGRIDLFVANGHVDNRPWANSPMAQMPLFFWGRDRGRFEVATPSTLSYFARRVVGRGVASGDLDNDGRVDLVVIHRDGPSALLWNKAQARHWLGIRLRGARSGKTPIGTRVTCRAGARSLVRWSTSGTGYLSAHDSRLWFGLGDAAKIDQLEVAWLSGHYQSWTNLAADRILEIVEDSEVLHEIARHN